MTRLPPHDVADLAASPAGSKRVEWARRQMPVLESVRSRFASTRPLADLRLGVSLHVTSETAVLLEALAAGGAELSVCASNPLSTNDEVAAYLVAEDRLSVFARRGEDEASYLAGLDAVIKSGPELTIDDGCDLSARLHGERREQLEGVLAGTEDTSTGALRLRALEARGELLYPVLALSDSATRTLVDNSLGTGQSVVEGILRSTNLLFAGALVVVAGYGSCGRGVAQRAKGLGARVVVTEVDPLRALEAATDGYQVMVMTEAAPLGDVFVTATGSARVIGTEHLLLMKDGAVLANAGQFDAEIDLSALEQLSKARHRLSRGVEEYVLHESGSRLLLLGEGRIVNLAAADGHPPQVMDVSFSLQALCCQWLAEKGKGLSNRVYEPPSEIDGELARLKLAAMGISIDSLERTEPNSS